MATIKSYTDIEQSSKLAEILKVESADMKYFYWIDKPNSSKTPTFGYSKDIAEFYKGTESVYLPCWSLSALLNILPYPQLSKDKIGNGKEGWMISVYANNYRYDSHWIDNPINACYEMILKLHELKLL